METRPLGQTDHDSTVLTFGAIALNFIEQSPANRMVEDVLAAGVNHFDVAPTYGDAELKLAPKLGEHRDEIFLGCKTQERTYNGAWGELHKSLERLDTDYIDLYQFHAVTRYGELATIVGDGDGANGPDPGALAAFKDARDEGLIGHIGLTSHGDPSLIRTAIKEIDALETVMFPMNYTLSGKEGPEHDYEAVLDLAREHELGTLGIKAFAKAPWSDELPEEERPYNTWYEPYDTPEEITGCLRFALSQGLTSIPNAGDPELVSMILDAAVDYEEMSTTEQQELIDAVREQETPVPNP